MSIPMLYAKSSLQDFMDYGSWDGLILVTTDQLHDIGPEWSEVIETHRQFDQATQSGVHLMPCPLAPQSRLILCCVGRLDQEGDDLRLVQQIAAQGMRRALKAGLQRPCLQVCIPPQFGHALEAATFGTLSALWVPLEARELARGGSIEALGVVCGDRVDLEDETMRSSWIRWMTSIEIGRSIARDVTGTEPERMAPPKMAALCKKVFKGTPVEVDIVKDRKVLEEEYPLLSAVARASWMVDRHQPRVIRLKYQGDENSQKMVAFAGKGVTYDTGGADLKSAGHMAGMSRDKGGAGAVIGVMLAIAHLRPKLNFMAEIGAVRNSIGADCFVTDEIITSHAGVRVRIGNTDAEGRLVLADLLSHLQRDDEGRQASHLISVATLTGHAYRALGPFTIAIDNDAARSDGKQINPSSIFNAVKFQQCAEAYGEGVELSRLRREDFKMIQARSLCEDVISCNNAPSTATSRGHQFPAAFLIKAAGLSNDGQNIKETRPSPFRFTHIDIGGSGVEDGDWQHGRPTAAPVLGLVATFLDWQNQKVWMTLLVTLMINSLLSPAVYAVPKKVLKPTSPISEIAKDKIQNEQTTVKTDSKKSLDKVRQSPLLPNEAMGTGGMVVSDNELASKIGMEVLKEGGDAVDAAIATTLALGVLQPFASGIGGGGFAVVYRKDQQYALDFREVAPAAATSDMYLDEQKEPIKGKSTIGALAAGVPGEVAGLYELHKRHGKLPWKRLVQPALTLARDGFHMHKLLFKRTNSSINRVQLSAQLSESLLDQGVAKPLGTLVRFPNLGKTLQAIADQGMAGFYEGKVALEIVKSIGEAKGIITEQDLKNYRVKTRAVIRGEYHGYTILSMPPPSSGGIVIVQALKSLERILEGKDPKSLGRESAVYLHALTEVLKHGFADRAEYMGDPDFTPVPVNRLLSERRIAEIKHKFDPNHTLERSEYGANFQPTPDGGTSHLNVLDSKGNAVALTTTINTGFGSRFVAGRSGVLLNNEMDDFIVKPGVPNAYGLVGKASNAVQANKRPLSSMSPTILLKNGKVVGLVGGSGGPTIITGTIQTLLNLIHFDGDTGAVGRAVNEPRIHHQWVPTTLMYDMGMSQKTLNALLARGHIVKPWSIRFNAVQALWVVGDSNKGETVMIGASDPSKLGRPAVVMSKIE